jgi:magnesium transporter
MDSKSDSPLLELQELGRAPLDIATWVETEAVPAAAAAGTSASPPPLDSPDDHNNNNNPTSLPSSKSTKHHQHASKKAPPATAAQWKWLVIDSNGNASMMTTYKTDVAAKMGIQVRDLRLLDPKLATSYPSAILCREHALVVNLEHIKMIITMEKVYITNLEDGNVLVFVEELQRRLSALAHGLPPTKSAMDLNAESVLAAAGKGGETSNANGGGGIDLSSLDAHQHHHHHHHHQTGGVGVQADMPYELRVLEIALDMVSTYLERLTGDLESAAHPALDALTLNVSTSNLERVRRIKNRMVRLTTRVETLREVLEKFLDDDGDMHDINLTAREAERQQDVLRAQRSASATPFDVPLPVLGPSALDSGGGGGGGKSPRTPRSALTYSDNSSEEEEEAIEEVEMVLEAYFMRIDNTYNKLQALGEYVDDTEDFINIELDNHRNQLIRIDLLLTALSSSVAFITAITALFAMNLQLAPGQDGQGPYWQFVTIAVTTSIVAVVMFTGVVMYCRYKRLL